MGVWQLDTDVLARSRFATSALMETVGCLLALLGRPARPGQQTRLAEHRAALRDRLAHDPVLAAFTRAAFGPFWMPDFLSRPPLDTDLGFADELHRVRQTPTATVLADLVPGRITHDVATLDRPDLAERVADLLAWVWDRAVQPDWPRRLRLFEADIVARTSRLSAGGWAAALDDMRPGMRWLGDGQLQINGYDNPPRDLGTAQLLFIPSTTGHGWVGWDQHRYAIVYPCSGLLAEQPGTRPGGALDALGRLLGPTRAAILTGLDAPQSTSQLVAVTGFGLGSVGNHLKVLLDAQLVRRRRSGRSVLYYRTPDGDRLVHLSLRKIGSPRQRQG